MKLTEFCFFKALRLTAVALGLCASLGAMVFRPDKGSMWDPSVLWHDGKYYAFMMYDTDGDDAFCLLATSTDGVHWEDQGTIISEHDRADGGSFFKCYVAKCGDKFIMDHGVGRCKDGHMVKQDELRFFQSKDLRHWEYITSTHPDDRWYRQDRWDHMYILPKEEGKPEAGYWGYVVAVPKQGFDLPGMMESRDGLKWEVMSPAKAEWGDTPPKSYFEYGGCERIGGKYYLIGGTFNYMGSAGYNGFTLISDGPRGPFRPDPEAFRLCGNSGKPLTWNAAWVRGNGELLVSNYTFMKHGTSRPWLLPLRKPVIDQGGHLRLGWWQGNEALKGSKLALKETSVALNGTGRPDGYEVVYLGEAFDLGPGVVIEGRIRARAATQGSPAGAKAVAGFVIEEKPGQAMALQLGIGQAEGRETNIGRLTTGKNGRMEFASEDVTGRGCATVTGLDDGREHSFRLLCRLEMFELYVDDLLMQTYVHEPGSGRVGFLVAHSQAGFSNLRAWAMSFPPPKAVAGQAQKDLAGR
jgi:hypothetical protein